MTFTVLAGGRESLSPVVDYNVIYFKALGQVIEERNLFPADRDVLKRFIFYGVKYINTEKRRRHSPEEVLGLVKLTYHINQELGKLTPAELMTIFPISKCYNGAKCETKDYFYTMKFLKGIGLHTPIGNDEAAMEILWEYVNDDLSYYCITLFSIVDESNAYEGRPPVMNQFLKDLGVPAYTKLSAGGKDYLENQATGEVKRIHKPRPRYLRLL